MKYWIFCIYFLFFFNCKVNAFNELSKASTSVSESVHTVKEVFDIKREFDDILKNKKTSGKKRSRRYSDGSSLASSDATATINKVTSGIGAFLKTYVYQPIAHRNFLEATIRSYPRMFHTEEGQNVFGTLNGELNQSFRSLMTERHPRTGDIISCRIPTSRMAEHYMMVINNKIAEVGVVGGKKTHNGVISFDSFSKSSYINSTECLYHENRIISRAEKIDEKNGADTETDLRYAQILERFKCTISGNNTGQFNYDVMSCNCQDLVLYWSYGYVETNCLSQFFSGCSQYLSNHLVAISRYVDESGMIQKRADEINMALINAGNIG